MKRILGIILASVSITTFSDGVVYDGEFYADTKGSAKSSTPYVHPTNVVNLASKESARLLGLEKEPLDSETLTSWFLGFPELGQSSSDTAVTIRNLMSSDWGSDELSGAGLRMYTDIMGLLYARWFLEGVYGTPIKLTQAQINNGISVNPGASGYDEDSPIQIGKHAVSAVSTQAVASITAANTKIRNVGIAIGAYATSEGITDIKNQNIAIGPFAHAVGSSMIAIGPGIRETTENDWTGNNAFASGPGNTTSKGGSAGISIGYHTKGWGTQFLSIGSGNSGTSGRATVASNDYTVAVGPSAQSLATKAVSLGHNSTATAKGAVQIGEGTNSTPNSLQFMGVKIVENGRLVGGNADPKEWNIQQSEIASGNMEVQLRSGSVTTVLPEGSLETGTKLYIKEPATGDLRNYEMYLPNEPEVRAGLPFGFMLDELPAEIKRVIVDGKWQAHKLPAKITITQPYSRLVMVKIEEFDDGTDWSPIITDAHVKWDGTRFTTDGSKLLEGTNLHSGVSLKMAYRIYGGSIVTNTVYGASDLNDQGILDGTFYNYTTSIEFIPPSGQNPSPTGGTIVPITLIYETKCGKSPGEFTVDLDLAP